jgi:predicted RNase H-like nuclease (RuvC/YqgF family)
MNGIGWEGLELMVERAVARLSELRKENAELRERLLALEERLAAGEGPGDEGRWRRERQEIGRRIDSLVARLEELVEETESPDAA